MPNAAEGRFQPAFNGECRFVFTRDAPALVPSAASANDLIKGFAILMTMREVVGLHYAAERQAARHQFGLPT